MPDELLGPLFDDLRLHQRSEGSHDAAKEMAATSQVAPRKRPVSALRVTFITHLELPSGDYMKYSGSPLL